MIRSFLRYGLFVAVPLFMLVLVVGCRSSGRHRPIDPCSSCGQGHQSAGAEHGQADDGHDHVHR